MPPKEKEEKVSKKKKAGSSGDNKDDDKFKRRNSLTDASSTSSSSSASSDISTISSVDSDESSNQQNEKSKSTMTKKDHGEGCSNSSTIGEDIVSRIIELSIDPSGNASKKPVKLVNDQTTIPISDQTHFKLLTEDKKSGNFENGKKKKNQKERKLTKKEKREQAINAGQLSVGDAALLKSSDKFSKKQVASLMKHEEPGIHISTFEDWGGSGEATGKMVVTGKNEAAREALGGVEQVTMPFYGTPEMYQTGGQTTQTGLGFMDGHQLCQTKYLEKNPIGNYSNMPFDKRLTQRMGFGVAGTGLKDNNIKTLSLHCANHMLKKTYSEHVEESYNTENWRNSFSASLINEAHNQDARYKELVKHMKNHVEKMITEQPDDWKKNMMKLVLDGEIKEVIDRFGEMDRTIRVKECETKKEGIKIGRVNFDEVPFRERVAIKVKIITKLLMHEYLETAPDHVNKTMNGKTVHVVRGVSVIMYLAATHEHEKPCFQNNHKKCTMLSFLLGSMDTEMRKKLLTQSFSDGLTPLHFATMTGWPCQIDVLLKYGSSTEITSDHGKTPLWFSARRNSTLISRQLMWHGADLSAVATSNINDFDTSCVSVNGYLSRKFLVERRAALKEILLAWISAYLSECDQNILLKWREVRSDIHEIRIGATVGDKNVFMNPRNPNTEVFLKTFPLNMIVGPVVGPIVLFLVPVSYTRMDTTMKPNLPHIVRVPLLHGARRAVDEMDKIVEGNPNISEEDKRKLYRDAIDSLKPVELIADLPILTVSDGDIDRETRLKPFFQNTTNGLLYGYLMPSIEQFQTRPRVTVTIALSAREMEQFHNCFFMAQVLELDCERMESARLESNEIDIKIMSTPGYGQKTKKD